MPQRTFTQEEMKKAVGAEAALLVQEGMLVGLGTGSTALHFIQSLIVRCRAGLSITAVSSSLHSLEIAKAGGIPIVDMDQVTHIDLTVDGADEIDPQNRMIKGGGGALLREKILASNSKKMVVIVDEGKLVDHLGKSGLPIEMLPFGYNATIHKLNLLGYQGKLRLDPQGAPYLTDNKNYIFDIHPSHLFLNPEQDQQRIRAIPGVLETGFFFNLASSLFIGYRDGRVEFR